MLNLNDLRHEMARYMIEHARGSLDSAIFHVIKLAYRQGFSDGAMSTLDRDRKDGHLD